MVGTTKGGGLLSLDIHSLLSFSLLSICLKIKKFGFKLKIQMLPSGIGATTITCLCYLMSFFDSKSSCKLSSNLHKQKNGV